MISSRYSNSPSSLGLMALGRIMAICSTCDHHPWPSGRHHQEGENNFDPQALTHLVLPRIAEYPQCRAVLPLLTSPCRMRNRLLSRSIPLARRSSVTSVKFDPLPLRRYRDWLLVKAVRDTTSSLPGHRDDKDDWKGHKQINPPTEI